MPCTDRPAPDLVRQADAVTCELEQQDRLWDKGFTRRRFLAGAGMVGAAALSAQLVTTRTAYGATGGNTVIFMFLRGGGDGLRMVLPTSDAQYLSQVRPALFNNVSRTAIASANSSTFAVHSALAPLLSVPGGAAFVPGVSAGDTSRSHFQAQALLERGGNVSATTGWLNRALAKMGPGTTFRAMTMGSAAPQSMTGSQPDLVMSSLADFKFPADLTTPWGRKYAAASETAIQSLYRGVVGVPARTAPTTVRALATARAAAARTTPAAAKYGASGALGTSLRDLAKLIKQRVGLQIATVDVGGWDTHTSEAADLDRHLATTATALKAFFTDLGSAAATTTVVVMTEFGRRVAQNGNGGTDHGHGQVMWLLGAGVKPGVHGAWTPLGRDVLDHGDVPTCNHAFDVLGEVLQKRLKVTPDASIFAGHTYAPLGVLR